MRPLETTAMLAAFERRGPGTDAERRAARRLARELTAAGHKVRTETFWGRPNWALAHAWHVALALAGSLLSVSEPILGAAMLGAALLSVLADGVAGVSPGRRLTPERASQNVVTQAQPEPGRRLTGNPTRLIIAANYDAGRTALVHRDALRRPAAWLRRRTGPLAFGWLAWLSLAITWSLVIAVVRTTEHHPPHSLGAVQLPPTVALVLALALLLEAAAAGYGPAANDNASGAAVAIALANALKAGPPRNLTPELVLQGAGEGQEIGMRRYLRTHKELGRATAIVLGVAPCGGGHVQHWLSDGRLIPLRYSRTLRDLCARIDDTGGHRGRGATPALPARAKGLPALSIGCLDPQGLAPRSHQTADVADTIDETALGRAVEAALILVDAIDAALEPEPEQQGSEAPATPA
jgi:Peptidase family M28